MIGPIRRFIKVLGDVLWGTNNISQQDLIKVKNGGYDTIIDTANYTYYDGDTNTWEKIQHD